MFQETVFKYSAFLPSLAAVKTLGTRWWTIRQDNSNSIIEDLIIERGLRWYFSSYLYISSSSCPPALATDVNKFYIWKLTSDDIQRFHTMLRELDMRQHQVSVSLRIRLLSLASKLVEAIWGAKFVFITVGSRGRGRTVSLAVHTWRLLYTKTKSLVCRCIK